MDKLGSEILLDKILFSYPTLLKEGTSASPIYPPEPLITGIKSNSIQSFIITAGLALETNKFVVTELDILFEGKGMVLDSGMNGRVEHPIRRVIKNNQVIYLSSMFVSQVEISSSGCYEIYLSVYLLNDKHEKTETLIDKHSSYFYVLTEEDE
ncbi:hypothetical protein [Pantoea sp. GbtcB22]|uniref:hypothetical protein n=1 Tax=Pantoea sp. GbtcB22 TaxID=2824767 RepID=UPI001C3080F3|nr:hypothetical protein [Pantoea sp. GbtcB22]